MGSGQTYGPWKPVLPPPAMLPQAMGALPGLAPEDPRGPCAGPTLQVPLGASQEGQASRHAPRPSWGPLHPGPATFSVLVQKARTMGAPRDPGTWLREPVLSTTHAWSPNCTACHAPGERTRTHMTYVVGQQTPALRRGDVHHPWQLLPDSNPAASPPILPTVASMTTLTALSGNS